MTMREVLVDRLLDLNHLHFVILSPAKDLV